MREPYKGAMPDIHGTVYVADGAAVIGDVTIAAHASVWYNAVIRGDLNSITIGERTSIQDGCVLHVAEGPCRIRIGHDVTVGHGAIVHGCTLGDFCLIGMGAVVLDRATVGSYSLIGAGTVIREGADIPGGVLVVGVPGKVVRTLSDAEKHMIEESAAHYVELARIYRETSRKA